jgi:predicted amidophosphoribosyltransferase
MSNPSNLPPGVRERDLDEASGVIRRCANCRRHFDVDEASSIDDLCPRCERAADEDPDR